VKSEERFRVLGIAALLVLAVPALWLLCRGNAPEQPAPQQPDIVPPREAPAPAPLAEIPEAFPPPAPPTVDASEPVAPTAKPESTEILVRDLADGSPVPAMQLRLTLRDDGTRSTQATAVSNDLGVAVIPASGVRSIAPMLPEWHAPDYADGEVPESGELWIFQTMIAHVTVRAEEAVRELDPGAVRLSLFVKGTDESPWSRSWLDRHRMRQFRIDGSLDATGRKEVELPRIPGIQIQASARGWRPAGEEVSVPNSAEAPVYVNLELEAESIPIRGTLTGSDGRPVPNTLVTAYVVVETTADKVDRAKIRLGGHNYTLSIYSKTGRAVIVYYVNGMTGEDGAFNLGSNVTGEVTLVVFPPAEDRPVFERMGTLSDAGMDVDLMAAPGPKGERVQFVQNGRPLADAIVVMSNLTLAPPQAAFRTRLDSTGRMPRSWLTREQKYTFRSEPRSRMVEFVWRGEKKIDVEALRTRRRK
jgi:hypothetical protein